MHEKVFIILNGKTYIGLLPQSAFEAAKIMPVRPSCGFDELTAISHDVYR